MIEAKRAPVRPRGNRPRSNAPLLLEEEVCAFRCAGARGYIAILGPSGSGKSTALRHLAEVLPFDALRNHHVLLDEPTRIHMMLQWDCLVIYAAERSFPDLNHLAVYHLAPWNRDDLIEYLLAVHRPRCASVMVRIRGEDLPLLGGLPELWRIVLDRLAADETIPDVRSALRNHLVEQLSDTDLLERARSACLNAVVAPNAHFADAVRCLARPGFADSLVRLLRHAEMQMLLAGERIAADLHGEANCDYLTNRLPRPLIESTAPLIAADERAREHLHALLAGPSWSHAMATSLLHAAGASVHLRERCPTQLAGAYLNGVLWPSARLRGADLKEAELNGAELHHADLNRAVANAGHFRQAQFMEARLNHFSAKGADLSDADLYRVQAESADFSSANLQSSDFTCARLWGANFTGSNLTGAVFRKASLSGANFSSAILKGSDFSQANLHMAILSKLCLREANWEGARFRQALMEECDLEYMTLPEADFEQANLRGALLTGSVMPAANFRRADLRNAGLADIEWENADLREADLRDASFHMGSTRSGLVGSTIPCEGSRTGFYTDDYEEQTYKSPEEIRKANLCGANLLGAILDGVDFYLVDLRGARFDAKYEEHLRRCGAILEARV